MEKLTNTVFFVLLAGMLSLAACGGSGSSESEEMAEEGAVGGDVPEPSAEAVAAANSLVNRLENSDAEPVSYTHLTLPTPPYV